MKKLVIEQPITDLYNVNAIKKLDERIETCDWVAAYVTCTGYIARLVSFRPMSGPWKVGFKYLNPASNHGCQLYFEQDNYISSIKLAIKNGNEVLLFNNEIEFIQWVNLQIGVK